MPYGVLLCRRSTNRLGCACSSREARALHAPRQEVTGGRDGPTRGGSRQSSSEFGLQPERHLNRKLRFQGFCRFIRLNERVFWSFSSTVRAAMHYWLAFSWSYNLLSDKGLRITVYSCANAPAGPLYAFRGGLRGAGASSTDSNIAANIERGF